MTQTRLLRVWAAAEEALAVGLLVAMTLIVLLQVVGRYVLTNPFIWTEEITRLLLIWLTFVAGAAVTRRGLHISVDMFLRPLPSRPRVLVAGIGECITAVSFAGLAWLGSGLALKLGTLPLAATRWPMSVMVWPATAGCLLIAVYAAVLGLVHLRSAIGNHAVEDHRAALDESVRS